LVKIIKVKKTAPVLKLKAVDKPWEPAHPKPEKKKKKPYKRLKRSWIKSGTVSPHKKATTRAVTAFNRFIRQRDVISYNLCKCSTCGAIRANANKKIHAGHFIKSVKINTKFDEQNVHAQCDKCNMYEGGREYEMSLYIDKKYGVGTAEKLYIKSQLPRKYSVIELDEITKLYRAKLKDLKGE